MAARMASAAVGLVNLATAGFGRLAGAPNQSLKTVVVSVRFSPRLPRLWAASRTASKSAFGSVSVFIIRSSKRRPP